MEEIGGGSLKGNRPANRLHRPLSESMTSLLPRQTIEAPAKSVSWKAGLDTDRQRSRQVSSSQNAPSQRRPNDGTLAEEA